VNFWTALPYGLIAALLVLIGRTLWLGGWYAGAASAMEERQQEGGEGYHGQRGRMRSR
jgi:hypothetical protein